MRSNDKLKTFELIREQTGSNKFFTYSGLDTNEMDEVIRSKYSDKTSCASLDPGIIRLLLINEIFDHWRVNVI